jgi:hypothetical protein
MMQKRGLSTIIVTLILILVSLVAVGIVWVVIRNVIQTGTEGVGLSQFSLSAKILDVSIDNSSNNISLTLKRNAGRGELEGISFVFSSDGNTEVITRNVSLKEMEQMSFNFHLNTSVSDLTSVSIVPLIKQDEKQISGIALDKYNLGNSKNYIPPQTCVPTNCSALGYICGTWNNGTCSGTLNCGNCTGGQTCNASGRCVLQVGGNITGNFRYVRAGAIGTNNGSDWINAYTTFPTTLLRNYTYYIASGNYGSYLFNTAESGTQIITIKKATVLEHGANVGWSDNYGIGQTVFGNSRYLQGYWNFTGVNFRTGYWTFDGSVGSGNNIANYGFTFKTDSNNYTLWPDERYIAISAGQTYTFNNMTLRHFAIVCSGGNNSIYGNNHSEVGVYAAGSQANVISPVLQYFYIDNCQVNMYTNGVNWTVEYGFFGNHWSSAVNHGVQIQDSYSIGNTFRNNIFNYCDPICIEGETGGKFYNNIFIPGPGQYANVRLISGSGGMSVFNTSIYGNTIINHRGWILYQTSGPAGSGNTVQNNLFYNSSGIIDVSGGNTINASYNSYFSCYNVNLSQPGVQNSSGNPFVNMGNGDFRLVSSTNPGLSLPAPYNLDFVGNIRGADGNWDRGAYEYF